MPFFSGVKSLLQPEATISCNCVGVDPDCLLGAAFFSSSFPVADSNLVPDLHANVPDRQSMIKVEITIC